MEIAKRGGIEGIFGDCGGGCACATCHVYVEGDWFEKVGPPDDIEFAMLDMVTDVLRDNSRLGCQIKMTPELDGIEVAVAPTSGILKSGRNNAMTDQAEAAKVSQRLPLTAEEQALLETGTLTDRAIQAHPRAWFAAMRKGDPIHHDKGLNSWLVTRHEDILAVQSDPITFSVNKGYHEQQARGMHDEFRAYLTEHGGGYFPDAIMSDPPYHTRIRKLMETPSPRTG